MKRTWTTLSILRPLVFVVFSLKCKRLFTFWKVKYDIAMFWHNINWTELFGIMSSLLSQLKTRLKENFLGSFIRASKKYANEAFWKEAVSDFRPFYKNATAYLEINFNFSSKNPLKSIALLPLIRAIAFWQTYRCCNIIENFWNGQKEK